MDLEVVGALLERARSANDLVSGLYITTYTDDDDRGIALSYLEDMIEILERQLSR